MLARSLTTLPPPPGTPTTTFASKSSVADVPFSASVLTHSSCCYSPRDGGYCRHAHPHLPSIIERLSPSITASTRPPTMERVVRRWRAAMGLVLVAAAAAVGSSPGGGRVAAHSSCVHPLESTWSNACRIGGMNGSWKNCPGPCPRDPDRKNYKVETFRRGQWFPLVYYKNNHSGMLGCGRGRRRELMVAFASACLLGGRGGHFSPAMERERIPPFSDGLLRPATWLSCCCTLRSLSASSALVSDVLPRSAGGFMRLTLVPPHHRFHAWAHKRNAFRWSCWDHGMVNCPRRTSHECGTDNRGKRYQQWVEIPKVFPDGYVHSRQSWSLLARVVHVHGWRERGGPS